MELTRAHIAFVDLIASEIFAGYRNNTAPFKNKTAYENKAKQFGITDKTEAKELAEFATLKAAREIINSNKNLSFREIYERLIKLYDIQPGLTHRTSWSTIYQQYSTPIPIAFAAGVWAGLPDLGCNESGNCKKMFEPSGGNGLFTIAASPENVVVNEIDKFRASILKNQHYAGVTLLDASKPSSFADYSRKFDAVITNPPFDKLPIKQSFDNEEWAVLDHLMAVLALSTMRENGKAAIIVGGHTKYDTKGRIQRGKNSQFISYLYKKYNVKDIINIDGELYRKQGTQFDIRLILIDGIQSPGVTVYPPLVKENQKPVTTFEELWDRIFQSSTKSIDKSDNKIIAMSLKLKLKAKAAIAMQGIGHSEIPEIEAVYNRPEGELTKIYSIGQLSSVFRDFYNKNEIGLRESFLVAFMDRKNRLLGIHKLSVGGKSATTVDISILVALAAKTNASAVAISHNHPSGDPMPSDSDIKLTRKIVEALKFIDISFADHIIIGSDEKYFSFAEKGLNGLQGINMYSEPEGIVNVLEGLDSPYDPVAVSCYSLKVNVPDSMDTEVKKSQVMLRELGDLVEFVRKELHYPTKQDLCDALAAEQIDAVAMAILKAKQGKAMIIGDQTGIGKGRQAAAFIRWVVENNRDYPDFVPPVFITEKQNLFSDIYRDLLAIGCGDYKPFFVNNDAKIKDEEKKVIFKNNPAHQTEVFDYYQKLANGEEVNTENPLLKHGYDFVVSTYSQFMQKKATAKRNFLSGITKIKGMLILDEAHNVSGISDSGLWFQSIVFNSQAALFLSATYAKRPDNMALYATKTSLKEIGADPGEFSSILEKGGTALQEVIASKLAENGEMVRRERPYEDVEVNYLVLQNKSDEHRAKSDAITALVRDIIDFEDTYVMGRIAEIDDEISTSQERTSKDNKSAGVAKTPMFSKIFQTIYQMLMAIKVDDVVERAISRLKSGHKVVIAFGNTMESFLNDYETGDTIDNDFAEILRRALEGTLRYTVRGASANDVRVETIDLADLGPMAMVRYNEILTSIKNVASGVTISPIDIMIQKLEAAGYVVDEVTGRSRRLEFNERFTKGKIIPRTKRRKEDQFFDFQNNKTDVLLINQSGSTGASAHAIPTKQVSAENVLPRCMIVLQPELDINKEIQKRGRINRTGQIYPPKFDYIVSNIPAETRLLMMLKNKLKSLDANTSGSTEQNKKMLDYEDIMNKYGDEVVSIFCRENEDFTRMIGDPLGLFEKINIDGENDEEEEQENEEANSDKGKDKIVAGAAQKCTGRVAILPTTKQEYFYNTIFNKYQNLVASLKESGDYDLDVATLPLNASTLEKELFMVGSGTGGPFSGHSYIEKCEINNLVKPLSKIEIEGRIRDIMSSTLDGYSDPKMYCDALIEDMTLRLNGRLEKTKEALLLRLNNKKAAINSDPKYLEMEPEEARRKKEEKLTALYNQYEQRVTAEEDSTLHDTSLTAGIFRFFTPGKSLEVVTEIDEMGQIAYKGVFIGFKIDFNQPNPYARSNINLIFAGLGGFRTRTFALRRNFDLLTATEMNTAYSNVDYFTHWDDLRKENNKNRVTAYIITGNVIAALTDGKVGKGRFIRFTSGDDGQFVRTGFLLKAKPSEEQNKTVRVPVFMAKDYILKMAGRGGIGLSKYITAGLRYGKYTFSVPRSKSEGGEIYQNQDLLIEAGGQFEASGQYMVLSLESVDRFNNVLRFMQDHLYITVDVPKHEMTSIEDSIPDDLPEITMMLQAAQIAPAVPEVPVQVINNASIQLKLKLKAKAAIALMKI